MGLLINASNLKKSDGTNLPEIGIFVKFLMQSDWDSFNQKFFLRFYTNHNLKLKGYSPIDILYEKETENGIIDIPLSNEFIKELDINSVLFYEQLMNQTIPNSSCFEKTFTTYHIFIKEYLENILGENTVEIRPDLG